jgi:hypothetical protein
MMSFLFAVFLTAASCGHSFKNFNSVMLVDGSSGTTTTYNMKQGVPRSREATIPTDNFTGDPVENFFKRLPLPPKQGPPLALDQSFVLVKRACDLLEAESKSRRSTDPDAKYLLEHIEKSRAEPIPFGYVFQQLCLLALAKDVADDDQSDKARYLQFCRWVANGRKDESVVSSTGSDNKSLSADSKAFLPEIAAFNKCAECGKEGAVHKCTGCLVRTEDHTTFATAYCGKECQERHWRAHKSFCQQLQQLHRAMMMFQNILEHYFTLTFQSKYIAKEITEQGGMVVVKYGDSTKTVAKGKQDIWSMFPHELAPSTDAARAALTHSRCAHVLSTEGARALLEMLIRREYPLPLMHSTFLSHDSACRNASPPPIACVPEC